MDLVAKIWTSARPIHARTVTVSTQLAHSVVSARLALISTWMVGPVWTLGVIFATHHTAMECALAHQRRLYQNRAAVVAPWFLVSQWDGEHLAIHARCQDPQTLILYARMALGSLIMEKVCKFTGIRMHF
jgi:hypothetical protein